MVLMSELFLEWAQRGSIHSTKSMDHNKNGWLEMNKCEWETFGALVGAAPEVMYAFGSTKLFSPD